MSGIPGEALSDPDAEDRDVRAATWSDLSSSRFWLIVHRVQVTHAFKGQITIPHDAWEAFSEGWKDPWAGLTMNEVMDELRGPVALPPDMVR